MARRLGAVLILLGVLCVLAAFCLDADKAESGIPEAASGFSDGPTVNSLLRI